MGRGLVSRPIIRGERVDQGDTWQSAEARGAADTVIPEEGLEGDSGRLGDVGPMPSRNGHAEVQQPLKIAIVGTAPGWEDAPFNDPSWTIWSLSRAYTMVPRYDAWFELHKLEEVCKTWEPGNEQAEAAARATYLGWLASQECPVFVREPRPELPNAQQYPIQEVLAQFPRRYFTNTISYMLAMAITAEPDAMGLWGVDMELSSEYGHQRPSCEYFIGIADGLGIEMIVPERSDLCKARKLYGFQDDQGFNAKMSSKRAHLQRLKMQIEAEILQKQIELAGTEGALEMTDYVAEAWEL